MTPLSLTLGLAETFTLTPTQAAPAGVDVDAWFYPGRNATTPTLKVSATAGCSATLDTETRKSVAVVLTSAALATLAAAELETLTLGLVYRTTGGSGDWVKWAERYDVTVGGGA